jgi:hypothetical protein
MPRQIFSVNYFCFELAPVAVGAACMFVALVAGCGGGPAAIETPPWDPSGLADQILSQLDKNGDGKVASDELTASPGLTAGIKYIDADNDGQLTRAEIEARFQKYAEVGSGLRAPRFIVTYRNRPVGDATLDFIPEPWLEGVIEPAHGTTDANGEVYPVSEGADVPGMRLGYYRVKVVSSKTKVPDKYMADATPLGAEVSLGDDASSYGPVELKITD